jgi:2-oxoglutarate dehydrogenase E2 component (dihydrolipoamide succinyltransferase)
MSVSVSMPQLGESVTEGTVTRWLKKEGERVEADEPLLEVSTDKVDTEIPSPVAGILRGITVAEDETVAVGAELAVIDEEGAAPSPAPAGGSPAAGAEAPAPANGAPPAADGGQAQQPYQPQSGGQPQQGGYAPPAYQQPAYPPASYQPPAYPPPSPYQQPPSYPPAYPPPAYEPPSYPQPAAQQPEPAQQPAPPYQPAPQQPAVPAQAAPPQPPAAPQPPAETAAPAAHDSPAQDERAGDGQAGDGQAGDGQAGDGQSQPGSGQLPPSQAEGPYVTPLVRKLAAEHGIDLASVSGTGVGGRIRKQDVLDAAREGRGSAAPAPSSAPAQAPAAAGQPSAPAPAPSVAAAPAPAPAAQPSAAQPSAAQPSAAQAPAAQAPAAQSGRADSQPAADGAGRPAIVPSSLRGTTVQMSRARQVIAKRMVESLHVSAQLTTVVEADVTEIARLRDRAKAAFVAREGVKLSFLPFFALAAVEALKVHPRLNAVIDTESNQVTYHDAEHLGIAVDTDRGLMVPVIRQAGDLNIGGLARKIADLAERTRSGRVSPDDLSGGTFTLTNTGSRGALFDTPIINQPQVAILGTGTVVKRPIVVEDPALGEVITVRSMVYLALTYDHRLVDGADAARFLVTMKSRLEEGAFETELGL